LARRNIRARRFDSTNAIASLSLMILLQFARCARASAGESLNRTTFPFTTAVAFITQANRKQEADKPSRFPSQANIMLPTAPMNIARHADSSRHGCPTAEVARGRSLVTFSALTIQRFNDSTLQQFPVGPLEFMHHKRLMIDDLKAD
jgi:hypothetical protein